MAAGGHALRELESILPGSVRLRIKALPQTSATWVYAVWPCGCQAEGHQLGDLLLQSRCINHCTACAPFLIE